MSRVFEGVKDWRSQRMLFAAGLQTPFVSTKRRVDETLMPNQGSRNTSQEEMTFN